MAISKHEKYCKDQQRRRDKFIRMVGPIPLCLCGCGNEVKIKAKNEYSEFLLGHRIYAGLNRQEVLDMFSLIRSKHNLSLSDISNITGINRSRLSSILFTKGPELITQKLAEELMLPLLFIYHFLPWVDGSDFHKISPSESNIERWKNPDGMVDFEPLRQEMFSLKDDLNTNWARLADYFNRDTRIFRNYFCDPEHKWIKEENFSYYRKEIRMIKSLSADRKAELFKPLPKLNYSYEDRDKFRFIIRSFKETNGFKTWKETAETIGITPNRLRGLMHDDAPNIRLSTYNPIVDRVVELLHERTIKSNSIIFNQDLKFIK
jgi:hypothetical protein